MIAAAGFAGLLLSAVPIAVALALTALILIALSGDWVLLASLPQQLYAGLDSYGLLALPLFLLLGEAMAAGGSGRRLMALAQALTGPLRGGLAVVTLVANLLLAAILGSTVAQLTVMSRMAVPEMEAAGYPREDAVAITAAGSMLAPVIPPSMLFIVFGVIAQVPIGDLFRAGLIPGVILGAAILAVIAVTARRRGWPRAPRRSGAERRALVLGALPALSIPALVVASIALGLATPTEAAALAALLALALGGLLHREIALRDLAPIFLRTAMGAAAVLFLVAAAQLMAWVLAYLGLPARIAAALTGASASPLVFILLVNLLLLAIGMVMDPIPALILTVPVLLPVATDQFGIDPVTFGLIACMNLSLGLLTPPVGAGLFTAAALTGLPPGRIAARLIPYLAAAALVVLAVSLVSLI